ncbi:MAG: hypothetical protein ABIK28_25190 [Planctomycetota bacterium]
MHVVDLEVLRGEFEADLLALWSDVKNEHKAEIMALAKELSGLMVEAVKEGNTELLGHMEVQAAAIAEIKVDAISKDTLSMIVKWAVQIVKYALMIV